LTDQRLGRTLEIISYVAHYWFERTRADMPLTGIAARDASRAGGNSPTAGMTKWRVSAEHMLSAVGN
jgi:hypothetical protein